MVRIPYYIATFLVRHQQNENYKWDPCFQSDQVLPQNISRKEENIKPHPSLSLLWAFARTYTSHAPYDLSKLISVPLIYVHLIFGTMSLFSFIILNANKLLNESMQLDKRCESKARESRHGAWHPRCRHMQFRITKAIQILENLRFVLGFYQVLMQSCDFPSLRRTKPSFQWRPRDFLWLPTPTFEMQKWFWPSSCLKSLVLTYVTILAHFGGRWSLKDCSSIRTEKCRWRKYGGD